MGVWIEIAQLDCKGPVHAVTPLVGVWIEIAIVTTTTACAHVTPLVGVWIEISNSNTSTAHHGKSLPLWECGLKYSLDIIILYSTLSLPLWECGLKCSQWEMSTQRLKVTPLVGVWIEIDTVKSATKPSRSHSPCGSVD